MCISLAQQAFLRGKIDGLPEDRLELMLRYIDDCERLKSQATPVEEEVVEEAAPEMSTLESAPLQV